MRIKRLLIILATIFLLGMTNVKANEIKSIDVDMYMQIYATPLLFSWGYIPQKTEKERICVWE